MRFYKSVKVELLRVGQGISEGFLTIHCIVDIPNFYEIQMAELLIRFYRSLTALNLLPAVSSSIPSVPVLVFDIGIFSEILGEYKIKASEIIGALIKIQVGPRFHQIVVPQTTICLVFRSIFPFSNFCDFMDRNAVPVGCIIQRTVQNQSFHRQSDIPCMVGMQFQSVLPAQGPLPV